jgi:hypothetical protein
MVLVDGGGFKLSTRPLLRALFPVHSLQSSAKDGTSTPSPRFMVDFYFSTVVASMERVDCSGVGSHESPRSTVVEHFRTPVFIKDWCICSG